MLRARFTAAALALTLAALALTAPSRPPTPLERALSAPTLGMALEMRLGCWPPARLARRAGRLLHGIEAALAAAMHDEAQAEEPPLVTVTLKQGDR